MFLKVGGSGAKPPENFRKFQLISATFHVFFSKDYALALLQLSCQTAGGTNTAVPPNPNPRGGGTCPLCP